MSAWNSRSLEEAPRWKRCRPVIVLLLVAAGAMVRPAWSRPAQQAATGDVVSADAMHWMQRWQQAAAKHPYAGTLTIMHEHGTSRSARVWHAVQGAKQIDRMETLSGKPRTIMRSGNEMFVWDGEGKGVRLLAMHDMPLVGSPFSGVERLSHSQQREIARHYRAASLGQQRVANYQADVVGFVPSDNLRAPYRFWIEQKTGLLLKWQMLELDHAPPYRWEQARVLREIAFSDVQIPAPVDYAAMQAMLERPTGEWRASRGRLLPTTSLGQQGWAWRKPLPGYVVQQCYQRNIAGMRQGRRQSVQEPQETAGAAGEQQVLHCVLTDGLSRFSLFIGLRMPNRPSGPPRRSGETIVRMASRMYDNAYQLTAIGAVPQAALQQAVDALYRP